MNSARWAHMFEENGITSRNKFVARVLDGFWQGREGHGREVRRHTEWAWLNETIRDNVADDCITLWTSDELEMVQGLD